MNQLILANVMYFVVRISVWCEGDIPIVPGGLEGSPPAQTPALICIGVCGYDAPAEAAVRVRTV